MAKIPRFFRLIELLHAWPFAQLTLRGATDDDLSACFQYSLHNTQKCNVAITFCWGAQLQWKWVKHVKKIILCRRGFLFFLEGIRCGWIEKHLHRFSQQPPWTNDASVFSLNCVLFQLSHLALPNMLSPLWTEYNETWSKDYEAWDAADSPDEPTVLYLLKCTNHNTAVLQESAIPPL